MADVEGKKLTELRVIDLKTELERRGLDKTGNKAALLERLSKAISDDGENPEEYLIVPCGGVCKTSPRKNSVTGVPNQDDTLESSESQKEEIVEPLKKENVDTQDTNNDLKAKSKPKQLPEENLVAKKEDTSNDASDNPPKESEIKQETKTTTVNKTTPESTPTSEKKPETEKTTTSNQSSTTGAVEANGMDNEDSINLTIGEDEENLLAEETESHDRHKVLRKVPDREHEPLNRSVREGEESGLAESDYATLIVSADGGEKKKMEENKKGDSKGSGRAEAGASNKEGTTSGANVGMKNKQDGGDGSKSVESGSKNQKREDKEKKTSQIGPLNASSRNLWVSGLSSSTRATDLKQIFSKYGKVIGAKVVTNARTPSARCYGYVTMSTSEDAAKCIQHLHRTELHGRVISVEKAKGDSQQSHMRKRDAANGKSEKKEEKDKAKDNHETNERKEKEAKKEGEEKGPEQVKKNDEKNENVDAKKTEPIDKKEEISKESDSRSTKSTSKKPESERGRREDKRIRPWDHHRSYSRSRSRERRRRDDVLTFAKIREERERQRLRERDRLLREEERRRREDMERQREIERRQREEAARLDREREKLRRERERIEQEKAELLRLERERQKLEREKLERERLELKRQQMRLEESRRAPPPPSIKRTSSDRRDPRDMYVDPERKRMATEHGRRHSPDRVSDRRTEIMDRVSDRRLDPSPPTRYESSRSTQEMGLKKEFKRSSEFTSRSNRPETFSDVSRGREVIVRRESLSAASSSIDPRQVKERYERPSTATYTREREVRRSDPESHRNSRDSHTRYSESFKPPSSSAPRDSRYIESNKTASGWHSGPPSTKSFNSVPSGGTRDPRNEPSGWSSRSSDSVNRWSNSSSMGNTLRHPVPPTYPSGPIQSMGLTAPGTAASYDRFDPYKSSISSMRKY
ncbi:PREDICTED: SAFB-like transcription modulator isoform X2 [Polistes dominula]|uniref:SAFB-like transcription modulator isoform X2 n=1 Tax=Polistes dominula TaxID=743375 RepID=A0ABM1IE67_POLDO|nr:PREDICTED: SAFB-like transcription modulator isoform X2 [Polistes dominula]